MHKHAPTNYICPFCCLVQKIECDQNQLQGSDIVYQNGVVTAFMATRRWPNNQGHVLVIPNEHYENIYDLPLKVAAKIHENTKVIALAMKAAYSCDGITLRQQNEPAGGQRIWHYHIHIIPRYENDGFHTQEKKPFPADQRATLAKKLRAALEMFREDSLISKDE
jgi:histidine triad (HIT) family protein